VTLSAQLKKWRGVSGKGKGLRGDNFTQEEAAGRLGVPLATYRDWEQGRKAPRGLALEMVRQKIARKPTRKKT
jgi:DNA-binding transcriptional regulator YiaG